MSDDFYRTLEVSKTASQEEIQKAYRKLARQHHPDMNQDDPKGAKEKFQKVQEAYDILGNPEKRKIYDQFGVSPDQMGTGGGHGPNQWSYGGGGGGPFRGGAAGNFNLDDILKMFGAGGAASGMGGMGGAEDFFGMGGASARRPVKGTDIEKSVHVPFTMSIQGGNIDLNVRRPTGKTETVSVKIPAGIVGGKKVRLTGLGNPGRDGGKPGNLMVQIQVDEHPFYTRKGDNLYITVPVTLKEAVFGSKIEIPTPKGNVSLTVPAGSSSGTKLRIRGCGVPQKNGEAGDLFAELSVALPKEWNAEDKKLLEQLKTESKQAVRGELRWH